MRFARLLSSTCLAATAAMAQDSLSIMEQSLAKQRASLGQQRAAIRVQVRTPSQTHGFFATPWTEPLIPPPPPAPECDPIPDEEIGPIVEEISAREGLTPDLLRAVIQKESSYLPCAISRAGAQGLMQLMPETAAQLGVKNPFDPRENVDGGARFLKQLIDRYGGNVVLALAAYNSGPGRVDAAGGVPRLPETMNYLSDILGKLDIQ